mmetsp:Transcript_30334/g.89900  ORF Transcript_30334/g.89900 Transcript_30334/m.89900 type:complete len:287 (+) Transcript_30334:177-1037(+)
MELRAIGGLRADAEHEWPDRAPLRYGLDGAIDEVLPGAVEEGLALCLAEVLNGATRGDPVLPLHPVGLVAAATVLLELPDGTLEDRLVLVVVEIVHVDPAVPRLVLGYHQLGKLGAALLVIAPIRRRHEFLPAPVLWLLAHPKACLCSDLRGQHAEALEELVEIDDAILVRVHVLQQVVCQSTLATLLAEGLQIVQREPAPVASVQVIEHLARLRGEVLLQQVHCPPMRPPLAHVVALDEVEGHLLADRREAALVVVRGHERAVLQQPLGQPLGHAARDVQSSQGL